jgi:N-methylhydantoinase A
MTAAEDRLDLNQATIRTAFEAVYSASFSRLLPELAIRIVSLRATATGRRPPFDFSVFAPGPLANAANARLGSRHVWFDGGWREMSVWSRLDLPVDALIMGPAILEQPDATSVIEPGLLGRVDPIGHLIVEPAP